MVFSIPSSQKISLEEFLKLPETKPASEYIDGSIHPKPTPQGKHSIIQAEFSSNINQLGKPQKLAYAFTELRCSFGGRSLVPDIAVFEWSNIPLDGEGEVINRFVIPPDWTIEIASPEQSANRVISKIIFCINQGTKLGWFIDPEDKSVIVFQPDRLPEVKFGDDILPVLSALENWQLKASDLFGWLKLV
jgi:Uma2 family endonuclease